MPRPRCSTSSNALIETVAELGSTNTALLARIATGAAPGEGHWLLADRQTAGRGRAGRVWNDALGNFMGSTIAHVRPGDPPAPCLSLVAGVALHRALGDIPGLLLKWPNDALVDGAKLAGILLERQGDCVVVGIGVNLAHAPEVPGRRTVSLAALGRPTARDAFAANLAAQWLAALVQWHHGGWPALRDEWLARAHPKGTLLQTTAPDGEPIMGAFAGLDADGAALIRLADGECRAIHAGDIQLVGE